jgi:hypothetical protein
MIDDAGTQLDAAVARLEVFLADLATSRGVDKEVIYARNLNELRNSDLRLLLDALKAKATEAAIAKAERAVVKAALGYCHSTIGYGALGVACGNLEAERAKAKKGGRK